MFQEGQQPLRVTFPMPSQPFTQCWRRILTELSGGCARHHKLEQDIESWVKDKASRRESMAVARPHSIMGG